MKKLINTVLIAASAIGVVGCGNGNRASLGAEYHFADKDFAYECSTTTEKFYVKDSSNDPFAEVIPNLRNIPDILQNTPWLEYGFNPNSTHSIGTVYYCDPEGMGRCIVRHVGDGWVVASTMPSSAGAFAGVVFINPEESYVEGQALNIGFYVLKGTEKVSLVNGSTQTMYAFVKLDEASNRLALEAKQHNATAPRAAEDENFRRKEERKKAYKAEYIKMRNEVAAKLFKGFKFNIPIHYPRSCQERGIVGKVKGDCFHKGTGYNIMPRQKAIDLVEHGKWQDFFAYFTLNSREDEYKKPTESEVEGDVMLVIKGRSIGAPWCVVEFVDASNSNCFKSLNEDYGFICHTAKQSVLYGGYMDKPEEVESDYMKRDGVKVMFGDELYIYSKKDSKLVEVAKRREDFEEFKALYQKHQQEY